MSKILICSEPSVKARCSGLLLVPALAAETVLTCRVPGGTRPVGSDASCNDCQRPRGDALRNCKECPRGDGLGPHRERWPADALLRRGLPDSWCRGGRPTGYATSGIICSVSGTGPACAGTHDVQRRAPVFIRRGAVVSRQPTRSLVSHIIRSSSIVTRIPLVSGRWSWQAPRPSGI